jgi:hypothetical protein
MNVLVIALANLCVCACVSLEVQPIGNGRYMRTSEWGLNARKETTEATKAANAYCAKQSKQMVLQNLDKSGNAAVFGESVSITFSCENK